MASEAYKGISSREGLVKKRILALLSVEPISTLELCSLLDYPNEKALRVHLSQLQHFELILKCEEIIFEGRRTPTWIIAEEE